MNRTSSAAPSGDRRRALAAPAALLLALAGCAAAPPSQGDLFLSTQSRSVFLVVDGQGLPAGVGVVVRATHEDAFVALGVAPARLDAPKIVLGDQTVVADVHRAGDLTVLQIPRAGRDLRPVSPAAKPAEGETLVVLDTQAGPWIDLWLAQVTAVSEEGALRLGSQPWTRPDQPDPPPGWAESIAGSPVFSRAGGLVGFVAGLEGTQPVVAPVARTLDVAALCALAGGLDVLAPEDARLTYRLGIASAADLPDLPDDWGGADIFLALEVGGRRLEPLEVTPGRLEAGPHLVSVPARGPVVARLVERDTSLAQGEVEELLTPDVSRPALSAELPLAFTLLPEVVAQAARPVRPRVLVTAEPVDVERTSGPDRTPLGARETALRRVASDTLDVHGGDATDFWAADAELPGPALFVLLRRRPDVRIQAEVFSPGFREPLMRLPPAPGQRLLVAAGDLPAGRAIVRVRELEGLPGEVAYSFFLAPRDDPQGLVRSLFRTISRESQALVPFLDSRRFADEVAVALSFDAGLDRAALSQAILAELGFRTAVARQLASGHRTDIVRHLALRLLEVHFPPAVEELERIHREGSGTRAQDAGLLLALRRPNDPRYLEVVRAAALDPDPLIRLRAVAIASRFDDRPLRDALLGLFRDDPSPLVRRALQRS